MKLSRAGYRKMVRNLAWGAGYNLVAIPLAAGVLAFAGITLSPAVGAILMSASTVVVAFNAQLLRRLDIRPAGAEIPDDVGAAWWSGGNPQRRHRPEHTDLPLEGQLLTHPRVVSVWARTALGGP
jgi:hypothetical protein